MRRSCQVSGGKVSNNRSIMSQLDSNSAGESRRTVTQYVFRPYSLRTDDLVLHCRGAAVPLAPKVALTLLALIEYAGEVVSKEELFRIVWGGSRAGYTVNSIE